MDFLKMRKLRKPHVLNNAQEALEIKSGPTDEMKNGAIDDFPKMNGADSGMLVEVDDEDDDDDFFISEVKNRLKELRRKNLLVLIPEEESCEEEEESQETSSGAWEELEVEDRHPWCGFDALYDKYCERMHFFYRMITQFTKESGSCDSPRASPQSASKKLASTFRCLSFKTHEVPQDGELLQQSKEDDHFRDIETAYVAQICLTWEALHCQYMQLSQKISSQPENSTSYSHVAQKFQQFQVLLQRFIENEPFEQGHRVEIYARSRCSLPLFLQVPSIQETDEKELEEEYADNFFLATDLIKIIGSSINTFYLFLKTDKKKSGALSLFCASNQVESSLQQVQASLDKKEIKLKELSRKKKGWNKKSWAATPDGVELLFGLIDIKVVSRVLRMARINKEQLLWCEEKMSKLDIPQSKLYRDGSPVLFPC